ncbi:b-box domain protein 31 [Quercus suber]|uniref:B-box domain protein 31 n=1 Tax=Quercus suber TaxID=58331 RepID=A0AAW0LNY6_QUESU
MKKCELCDSPAKMFCESDQASLCWDCDAQVHGANFLVAKHSRRLLCHVCQSLTPWSGSGPKLLPTVSVYDEENQVVPWSSTPPPQASSSSTSEEGLSDSRKAFSWKRTRENAEFHSQVCLSSLLLF